MTRLDKCKLAIERGITYNPETGKIYGVRGKEITAKTIKGYIVIKLKFNGKYIDLKAHQLAWYYVNKEIVEALDHINGVKDDNRICNLRSVTHQENQFNRTTAKGYYWNKTANKWLSQIQLNSKKINLGLFKTEEEAREAYLKAKEKYHKH